MLPLKGLRGKAGRFRTRCHVPVDAVVLFDEDTPLELIKIVQPDVLVKGGDYTEDTIVGADIMKANGGEVIIIPIVEGYSTSKILNSIV
jgi:bifunctional ADP-heptose synthase (sugar kinase/adenylyltransferase)